MFDNDKLYRIVYKCFGFLVNEDFLSRLLFLLHIDIIIIITINKKQFKIAI